MMSDNTLLWERAFKMTNRTIAFQMLESAHELLKEGSISGAIPINRNNVDVYMVVSFISTPKNSTKAENIHVRKKD